ncbi:MAG: hypothetical protein ACLPWG_23555, partial [Steroidobacteraceae bacterium]
RLLLPSPAIRSYEGPFAEEQTLITCVYRNPYANWLKREVESATRLTLHGFAWLRSRKLTASQVPSFAHIWAHA